VTTGAFPMGRGSAEKRVVADELTENPTHSTRNPHYR
jgi:hypothetical protein